MWSGGGNYHQRIDLQRIRLRRVGPSRRCHGSNAEATLNSKLTTVCNAVKAKDILVYTIGFQITNTTTQNLLKNCATKPDMYYNSPTNAQLAGIFQDIAQGLSELRIAR